MEDREIIELYWQRNECAISETAGKYGSYCFAISHNILSDGFEAEECVNDTWLKAWNAMPPQRPSVLSAFLGKITRNLSVSRLRLRLAQKRGGGEAELALEELKECISTRGSAEDEVLARELARHLNSFLSGLDREERDVFVSRYWFGASIAQISKKTGSKPSRIKSMLMRSRRRLLGYLQEEANNG